MFKNHQIRLQFRLLGICLLACLVACHSSKNAQTVKVGTIMGPESVLMETAKEVAAKQYNLTIKIVEFSDYVVPNAALADGSIDANVFQHLPYLEEAIANKHYKIISIGKTFVFPMALYSKKVKDMKALRSGAIIAIPNDSSNEARALALLAKAGLITLDSSINNVEATPANITQNPRHLVFKELNAAQLARHLDDIDAAAINSNYAIPEGLLPSRDALLIEDPDPAYANVVVVKEKNQKDPRFKDLLSALHSKEVQDKANELFKGEAIPAWDQTGD